MRLYHHIPEPLKGRQNPYTEAEPPREHLNLKTESTFNLLVTSLMAILCQAGRLSNSLHAGFFDVLIFGYYKFLFRFCIHRWIVIEQIQAGDFLPISRGQFLFFVTIYFRDHYYL